MHRLSFEGDKKAKPSDEIKSEPITETLGTMYPSRERV